MDDQPESLFPLSQAERTKEFAELIAQYRVSINQLVGRLLYLERDFRRHSDNAAQVVGGFVDGFLDSCSTVPDKADEWDGGKCYNSSGVFVVAKQMYYAARDLRQVAKKIVTLRRHFYRDLTTLARVHGTGGSFVDSKGDFRLEQRRQFTPAERQLIWSRSERLCRYCRIALPSWEGDIMHIDHVVPVIAGGSDELENLAATCITCNLKKNAKSEERFLAELLAGGRIPKLDGLLLNLPEQADSDLDSDIETEDGIA